jgi:hypothetical protein
MRLYWLAVFADVSALGLVPESLWAQSASQTVTYSVVAMSRTAVSSASSQITMRTATAGRTSTSVSVSETSFAITTNESNQKIAASLDEPMPSGMSLAVSLAAPAGAASAGSTNLGTASADVVTGISGVSAMTLPIVYTLSANANASAWAVPRSRVVTFTFTAGL